MERSNLDIWAIQEDPEEINPAVEGVESSSTNLLFGNCISYLRLGRKKINVQFNTAFYSEDSDRLILLMKDGAISEEQLKEALDQRGIFYNEVYLLRHDKKSQSDIKTLWFAREVDVLDSALKDSRKKGIDTCDYYPEVKGRFELRYVVDEDSVDELDSQKIRGVVVLDDKLVLMINNGENKNAYYHQILKVLQKNDMAPNIHLGVKKLPEKSIPKQYKKEQ